MEFSEKFFDEASQIATQLKGSVRVVESIVNTLKTMRDSKQGRLFVLGVGGSAGNASHAVNDFRKLCGIEAYAPTDNVSELTARTNDDGFDTVFEAYLKTSKLTNKDCVFVFSVGGGSEERNISMNLVKAIKYAKEVGSSVVGVVGKPDGYAALHGDHVVVIPQVNPSCVTPHSEAFQAVVWHCIVSHPMLQTCKTTW